MTGPDELPTAARPFVEFATLLRTNGFPVAPEQTLNFLTGVGLLGPRSMLDVHRAALATLAPSPERRTEFDALFAMFFLGRTLAAPTMAEPESDDDLQILDDGLAAVEPPDATEPREVGAQATAAEALSLRRFAPDDPAAALVRFRRAAPSALPRRRSYRRRASPKGTAWDMQRLLRQAARRDGEVLTLPKLRRSQRQRRILLLVDVSGSMKAQTDIYLRFAHALGRAAQRFEAFTVGTRLTRVSRALRHRRADQALAMAGDLVSDWDGGTRLGDALAAFLAVPRFASFSRGALVIVLSDGLERGDPRVLTEAVEQLARLAWRILWLTPLAADRAYVPRTEALVSVLPFVERLGDGSTMARLCEEVLAVAGRAA